MTSRYEFPPSQSFDSNDQGLLFDIHTVKEDTGERRVRVTQEQIEHMRERRRILSQEAAQRRDPASQPSVPFRLGRIGIKLDRHTYRAGP